MNHFGARLLAVDELNKEGVTIKGKPVKLEIVAMDDRSDPKAGVDVAKQLVEAGVVAVIGNLNSGVSIPAAPVYAEKHIAQLAISTNPKFTELGFDTTFRLVADDNLQARAIGSFAANQMTATKFAVIDDGTPYGKGLTVGADAELKKAKKEVTVFSSDDKTTAFDDMAGKIKAGGIEVIVSTQSDFQILALMEALKKIDYNMNVSFLGGDTIKTTAMLKGIGMSKALYSTSPILDAKEFVSGPQFLDRYRAAFKVDPAKITKTLRSLDGYAPITGSMKWDAVGEQRYGVVGMYSARGGNWELQMRSDRW